MDDWQKELLEMQAYGLKVTADALEIRLFTLIKETFSSTEHWKVLDVQELVQFFIPENKTVIEILDLHHDHPDAYTVWSKRKEKLESLGFCYILVDKQAMEQNWEKSTQQLLDSIVS